MRVLSFTFLSPIIFLCASTAATAQETEYVSVEEFDEAMEELDLLRSSMNQLQPGDTNLLISGFFTGGFTDAPDADSTFSAGFSPVFLWTLGERIMFEGELELQAGGAVGLDYAQMTYLATDYLTLGAGQFLSPFGLFSERIHPTWINKLPGAPFVAGHGGLSPNTILGVQARGAVALGAGKINYAVFAGNGPQLNNGLVEEAEAGVLHWESGADVDNNKVIGGRFGIIPMAGLEIGASVLSGKVAGDGTSETDVDVNLLGLDLTAQHDIAALQGALRFDGEYVSSKVGDTTYLPSDPGSFSYDNKRSGGYGQLAFRPTKMSSTLLQDAEFIVRYDWLDLPDGAPENEKYKRLTYGLDYWLGPSSVLKFAVDSLEIGDAPSSSTFYVQIALGF